MDHTTGSDVELGIKSKLPEFQSHASFLKLGLNCSSIQCASPADHLPAGAAERLFAAR